MEALLVLFFIGLVIFVLIKVFRAKGKRKPLTNRRDHERSSRAAEGYSPYTRVSYQADASRSRRKPVDPDTVWVPANQPCEIAGYTISKGMVYVGEYLQSAGGYSDPDPALINPRLKVDRMQPNLAGDGMTYWPSYSGIDPASRAAYLDWLSGDRSDPNTYIGYVFLYFYGLERRALADAINSGAAQSETDAIWGEVNRLLTIYRGNNSFRNYACELMEVLSLRHHHTFTNKNRLSSMSVIKCLSPYVWLSGSSLWRVSLCRQIGQSLGLSFTQKSASALRRIGVLKNSDSFLGSAMLNATGKVSESRGTRPS
jgi:hypothetical protein